MKNIKQLCFALLAITMIFSVGYAQANSSAQQYTQKDLDRMSIFVSNFSETFIMNVDDEFKNDPQNYVHFGVWHNFLNNYNSRIKSIEDESGKVYMDDKNGPKSIDVKYVKESLKKYLNLDIDTWPSTREYTFEKNKYIFEGNAYGMKLYAKVTGAQDKPEEGVIVLTGYFYDSEPDVDYGYKEDYSGERYGTFEARVKNHEWKGKKTWYMVDLKLIPIIFKPKNIIQ